MSLMKTFIFGLVAAVCVHFVALNLWKNNNIPSILVKFKWIIFILFYATLFLVQDYSNLLNENLYVILIVNLFLSYIFILPLNNKEL